VRLHDAYLGGERTGGKAGRGSENKVPFVAAVSLTDAGHPLRVKLNPVPGFTLNAIAEWAKDHLAAGSAVKSDGLACWSSPCLRNIHARIPRTRGRNWRATE